MPTFRPGKPRLTLTIATPLVVTNVAPQIIWDTVVQEDPVWWDPLFPGQATLPMDGLFIIVLNAERSSGNAVSNSIQATILVNGTAVAREGGYAQTSGASDIGFNLVALEHLAAGDVITAEYNALNTATTLAALITRMSITRVGPERWTG